MVIPPGGSWRRIAAAVLLIATAGHGASATAEPRTFEIDPNHFFVTFLIDHAGFSKVVGQFLRGEGRFVYDEEARTVESGTITIYSKSVFTDDDQRDKRLRGEDFLDAGNYSEIVFEVSAYTPAEEEENQGKLSGQLSFLEETRPVTMEVAINRVGRQDDGIGEGPYVLGASARTAIVVSDWGMSGSDQNGAGLGDEVELLVELEAHRQPK